MYTKVSFFEKKILAFGRFWVKEPRRSENKIAEMCYLYRRTRPERSIGYLSLNSLTMHTYRSFSITLSTHKEGIHNPLASDILLRDEGTTGTNRSAA